MTVSADAMFIGIDVDDPVASDAAAAKQLAGICPVDIYTERNGRVALVGENIDECILCGLCLDVGPAGAVRVRKLYDGGAPLVKS
jgi:NAD-dependent dihydropyrimidine dehydrogenase PreA subunit